MALRDFTPYLSLIMFFAGFIFLGDHILKDTHKERFWRAILNVAHLADHPRHVIFYCVIVSLSLAATAAIVALSGLAETEAVIALKSLGPLLLPVTLKVFVLDYCFALKSSWIIRRLLASAVWDFDIAPSIGAVITSSLAIALLDFAATGFITYLIFNRVEFFQAQQVMPRLEAQNLFPSFRGFFDALSLLGKASMEYSLYTLNGTTLVWVLLLLARFSDGAVGSIDAENVKRNICKVTGTMLAAAAAVVVVIRAALT